MRTFVKYIALGILSLSIAKAYALGDPSYVSESPINNAIAIVSPQTKATLYVDPSDFKGVKRALADLQLDIEKVSGEKLNLSSDIKEINGTAVIVGTIGHNPTIDALIQKQVIKVGKIQDQWDAYSLQVIEKPFDHIERAFVIVGANKRGTIYGIYDFAEQIGVSPWYYWADVPIQKKQAIYVHSDININEVPVVKYRGIFLNDEAPALTNWVKKNHGNYTHEFYVKVFELLLRLKANFIWPAMWNNAFNVDSPLNMVLADEYGIVMGTSHHEPMMRAHKEWTKEGKGRWDYAENSAELQDFWRRGIERNKVYESIITLGMRGDGDEPMSESENISLLEHIVSDQREIIKHSSPQKAIENIPQVWTLYKEVQGYYDKGMRVPDDVILLWADDNWGNIRRLPRASERKRSGGAGVYYHFDYVGGPRSYRWINTVPISKIWEQMNLAHQFEANKIWITNVGDLKPMEFPIEFFLRMAWNPNKWPKERLVEFGKLWATREFGAEYAEKISELIAGYTRHNGRRKPELMSPETYSILNYGEAERILQELDQLETTAVDIYHRLSKDKQAAYFQLVLHPVKATANITRLNIAVAKNRLYANQGRQNANLYREAAKTYFTKDKKLKEAYHSVKDGKWQHMMDQSHIGYTNWQNPEGDQMPVLYEYIPGDYGEMGIAVEGFEKAWPSAVSNEWPHTGNYELVFDYNGKKTRKIEIFNRGSHPFDFKVSSDVPWLKISQQSGEVKTSEKINLNVDWNAITNDKVEAEIVIRGTGWQLAKIAVKAHKPNKKLQQKANGFIESDGYISIEAANFTKSKSVSEFEWQEIPMHGRTKSSMSVFPTSDKVFEEAKKAPYLEYDITFFNKGTFDIDLLLAPTWPVVHELGLRYAIQVGNQKPIIVNALKGFSGTDKNWEWTVENGVRVSKSQHKVSKPGPNKLRIYAIDPAVTIQKIIVNTGGLKYSYLGPPESSFIQ